MNIDNRIMSELEATYEQRPDIINEAIAEYLENVPPALAEGLKEKIKEKAYNRTFSLALLQIASLISGAMLIQTEETETDGKINDANSLEYTPENRYNKLRKQVLFEARNDDQLIQNMRLYYLDSIDYSEVVSVLSSEVQRIRFAERIKEFKKDYHNSKML